MNHILSSRNSQKRPNRTPDKLKQVPRWVVWKAVQKGNGKVSKVPVSSERGKAINPLLTKNHLTYAEAIAAAGESGRVGFVLGDGWQGIDLDNVLDATGAPVGPWVKELVSSANTYVEVSPSGRGLKLFFHGGQELTTAKNPNGWPVEIYTGARFFTVTGNAWTDIDFIAEANYSPVMLGTVMRHRKYYHQINLWRAYFRVVAEEKERTASAKRLIAVKRKDENQLIAEALPGATSGRRHASIVSLVVKALAMGYTETEAVSLVASFVSQLPAGDHPVTLNEGLEVVKWAFAHKFVSHPLIDATNAAAMQFANSHFWPDKRNLIDLTSLLTHAKVSAKSVRRTWSLSKREQVELTGIDDLVVTASNHRLMNAEVLIWEKEAVDELAAIYSCGKAAEPPDTNH